MAFRRNRRDLCIIPSLAFAHQAPSSSELYAIPIVNRPDAPLCPYHLKLPSASGYRPGFYAIFKSQLKSRARIKSNVIVLNRKISWQQLTAHRFDFRVAQQERKRIYRVDMPVHQRRSRVMNSRFGVANFTLSNSATHGVIAHIKSSQNTRIEHSTIGFHRFQNLICPRHRTRHRLLHI